MSWCFPLTWTNVLCPLAVGVVGVGFSIYPPLFAHQCWMYCTAFPSELRVFIVVAFSICLWFQSIKISILYIDLHKLNYMIIYYIIYTYILSTVVCTNLAHRFKFYISGLPLAVRVAGVAADDPLHWTTVGLPYSQCLNNMCTYVFMYYTVRCFRLSYCPYSFKPPYCTFCRLLTGYLSSRLFYFPFLYLMKAR